MEIVLNSGFIPLDNYDLEVITGGGVWGALKVIGGGVVVAGCVIGAVATGGAVCATPAWWVTIGGGACIGVDGLDGN